MRLFVGFSNTIHKYFIWFSQLALFVGYCVFPCQSPLLLTISTNSTKKPKSRKKSKPNGRKHHGKMPREVKNQNLTKNPSFHRVSKSKANDHCIFFKSHTLQYTPKQSPFLIFKKIYFKITQFKKMSPPCLALDFCLCIQKGNFSHSLVGFSTFYSLLSLWYIYPFWIKKKLVRGKCITKSFFEIFAIFVIRKILDHSWVTFFKLSNFLESFFYFFLSFIKLLEKFYPKKLQWISVKLFSKIDE